MDHEVESDHSLPHQQVLKGSTYPTTLRSGHIVFSMAPVVKHLQNPASTQFAMQIMMHCPKVVICPGDVARHRGDDTGAKATRWVEDVVDTGGEGGVVRTSRRPGARVAWRGRPGGAERSEDGGAA